MVDHDAFIDTCTHLIKVFKRYLKYLHDLKYFSDKEINDANNLDNSNNVNN